MRKSMQILPRDLPPSQPVGHGAARGASARKRGKGFGNGVKAARCGAFVVGHRGNARQRRKWSRATFQRCVLVGRGYVPGVGVAEAWTSGS